MAVARGIKRLVCGVSGGVDSAVAAALLQRKGFEVIGAYMKNWDDQDEEGTCRLRQEDDYQDAKHTCAHLRIPFVEVSFVKDYWNQVFSELLQDYERGFTPNPDILCNRYIKFGSFYRYARSQLDADAISTGHYAQSSFGPFLESYDPAGVADLRRAVDGTKDQTLFLSDICQESLRRTMFPLGPLYKHQVRRLAQDLGLDKISKKKDSVGICFVGDRKFPAFISKYLEDRPGEFVCIDTKKVVGQHRGVHHWTLGQRTRVSGFRHAYYVCHLEPKTRTVYAALGRDHATLYSRKVTVALPHWISHKYDLYPDKALHCMFKFQHKEWTIPCQLTLDKDNKNQANLFLSIASRAITPGQQAVFYKGNVCIGSAKILGSDAIDNIQRILDVETDQLLPVAGRL